MATNNNDKVLNFSGEREQHQACLNDAEQKKNQGSKIPNVPNLRFPEFNREWLKKNIGEVSLKVGSGVTPRGGESVYKTEGHPFVRSQNVGYGYLLLDDIAYIDEETHLHQKNTELQINDVLLNITGASIGRSAIVNEKIKNGNVNQHVCIIRPNSDINSSFLCNFLLSTYGQKQIDSFQAGGNRQGLNFEQIKSIKINLPKFEEQKKITQFLSLIDERIDTQNKIIEDLKLQREAIMVKHYQHCSKTESSIAELGEPFSAMNLAKEDLAESGTPCILYGELFTTYGCVVGDVVSHTNKTDNATLSSKRDLLFPASTTVDALSLITPSSINEDGIILGGDMFGIHVDKCFNNNYLSYYFNIIAKKNLAKYAKGSTIIHLHYADIMNVTVALPSKEEQDTIAALLMTLEQKISIEQQLQSTYQNTKHYFLQQLFI